MTFPLHHTKWLIFNSQCGLKHKDITYPRRALCERNLAKNGPLETQFQLKGPDGNVSWRYAPFLDAQRYSAGPKVRSVRDCSPICLR